MNNELKIKGITKATKGYMKHSQLGGYILYDSDEDTVEFIDRFYNSFRYQNYEGMYVDGTTYWDNNPQLITVGSGEIDYISYMDYVEKDKKLDYTYYSNLIKKLIKNKIENKKSIYDELY